MNLQEIFAKFINFVAETKVLSFLDGDFFTFQDEKGNEHEIKLDYDLIATHFPYTLKDLKKAVLFNGDTVVGPGYCVGNEIYELKELEYLDVRVTNFHISEEILQMTKLKTLFINATENKTKFTLEILKKHKSLENLGFIDRYTADYQLVFALPKPKTVYKEWIINGFGEYVVQKHIDTLKKYFQTKRDEFHQIEFFNWGICLAEKKYTIYLYEENGAYADRNNITLLLCNDSKEQINRDDIYFEFLSHFVEAGLQIVEDKIFVLPADGNSYPRDEDYISLKEVKQAIARKQIHINHYSEKYTINEVIEKFGGVKFKKKIFSESYNDENNIPFYPIKALSVKDFKLFKDIKIDQLSPNVNIIIGKNGVGKTSFLQAITLVYANAIANDNEHKFLSKRLDEDKTIPYTDKYCEIEIETEDEPKKNRRILSSFNRSEDLIFKDDFIVFSYGVNLFSHEKLDHTTFAEQIFEGSCSQINVSSIFKDYTDEFYNPVRVLNTLIEMGKAEKLKVETLRVIRNIIVKTINDFLAISDNDIKIIQNENGVYSFFNNTKDFGLGELSEGYRANILLVSNIIMQIIAARSTMFKNTSLESIYDFVKGSFTVKGVILIDEFDRHLHPSWQRVFLNKIIEILPKIQFFVTTHNILATQSAEGYKALIINTITGDINAEPIKKGYDFETIYNLYFGGNNEFLGVDTQRHLTEFRNLIDDIYNKKIKPNSKKLKLLTDILLSENMSEFVQAVVTMELAKMQRITNQKTV